jgi:hypothetical protein
MTDPAYAPIPHRWPAPHVVSLSEAGPRGTALSLDDGESRGIYPLVDHPGWLVKIYKTPQDAAESARLDWLIAVPD